MDLAELVQNTERQLTDARVSFGHGTTNARDEAVWLVLHALGLPLDIDLDDAAVCRQPIESPQLALVTALLNRRIQTQQPLAYLIHEAWLQGVPFYVDERTIVPRSLIAEIIADGSIDPWLTENTHRVLDLCTGNGSLAILAAMAWPDLVVDAADISPEALEVARINLQKHQLAERIRIVESDGLDQCQGPYDLILCNPPYVNAASMEALPAEYRAEPELALAGGLDGMDFIRKLLTSVPKVLSEQGVLVLEIGHERDHFEAAFPHLSPIWLDTSGGGDQVLMLDFSQLNAPE